MFFFNALITRSEIWLDSNIHRYESSDGTIHFNIENNPEYEGINPANFFEKKGIFVKETDQYFEVYNDPYCSIPVYIYTNEKEVSITSSFEKLLQNPLHIDAVGVYETLYFESALHDRTMFCEIRQLPAASCVKVNKETLKFDISSYWDFEIMENCNIRSEDEAVDMVWEALCDAFKGYKDKELLMGISGGVDSRLSMCVLNHVADINKVDTFTFGHNKKILDYMLAKKVCEELGCKKKTQFFKLDGESYLQSLSLPIKSGGAVGVQHAHAYWCIQQTNVENKTLISNYYSDAVMGYDCVKIDYEDTVENCDYYKTVIENRWSLPWEIQQKIIDDIRKITDRRKKNANFSCYNEFIYLVERNPKFHVKLSHMYNEFMEVALPYAQFKVLQTMISLPLKYRYRKKIEHLILSGKFKDMKDISSTRYAAFDNEEQSLFKKIYYDVGFLKMRAINFMNCGLNMISAGKIQIPNKYITENHLMIMNRFFTEYKKEACTDLFEYGLITENQKKQLSKTCKRTIDAQVAFSLISAWTVLHECKYLIKE